MATARRAAVGDSVLTHYTGRTVDGEVFDSSREGKPLEFTLGKGEVIPGFDEAVVGMTVGETKTHVVPADKAYGAHQKELVFEIPKDEFPDDSDVKAGQRFEVQDAQGATAEVRVLEVLDDRVRLDANHPLAGQDLEFDIELVSID